MFLAAAQSYDVPVDGSSLTVPAEIKPLTKIQLVALSRTGAEAIVVVEELEGCAHRTYDADADADDRGIRVNSYNIAVCH